MIMKFKLTRSLEDYLEAIYTIKLEEEKKVVRVKDIANKLNISMASVVGALEKLSNMGLIEYRKREYVDLTQRGEGIAKDIYERERLLTLFLKKILLLSEDEALEEACKLEHDLSSKSIHRLSLLIEFINNCYGEEFRDNFRRFIREKNCI